MQALTRGKGRGRNLDSDEACDAWIHDSMHYNPITGTAGAPHDSFVHASSGCAYTCRLLRAALSLDSDSTALLFRLAGFLVAFKYTRCWKNHLNILRTEVCRVLLETDCVSCRLVLWVVGYGHRQRQARSSFQSFNHRPTRHCIAAHAHSGRHRCHGSCHRVP